MALRNAVCDNLLQDRFHTPGTALHRALMEAPFIARCSDNKTAALTRPRELAIRLPYMQYNRHDMVSWLVFDLDHTNPYIWEQAGLPPPNLIVKDRTTNKSQIRYAIEPVCTSAAGRSKPIAFMKSMYEAYRVLLQADANYKRGNIAKTPGHPWWDTEEIHGKVYSLGELAEYLPLPDPEAQAEDARNKQRERKKAAALELAAHSRHCMLFELVRHYAYSIVNRARSAGNLQSFTMLVDAYAHNSNTFGRMGYKDGDLPLSSVRATVKSISRWTWDNYTGNGRCHRGAMRLDDTLPIPERQRLSAERTHEVRRKATESKIRAMCQNLRINGRAVTIAAVAQVTRLTRQTVAKYKHVLAELGSSVINLPPRRTMEVKYGAHQVTGRFVSGMKDLPTGAKQPENTVEHATAVAETGPVYADNTGFDAKNRAVDAKRMEFTSTGITGSSDPPTF